ncbi:MAG TPA: FAD-dependent oxidoreductase [Solirubrobacterales bacterium]|nr:FAD-dependent oxidoreductase [Solirubrobacterales bacterium]
MGDAERIVIVGASLAGARAAEGARDAGFEGEILLIGDEPERPYERPPLSKDYLRGEKDDLSWVHDEDFYTGHGIDLRTLTVVTGIDPGNRKLLIEGSDPEPYDRLLLATGCEPRRIEIQGADLEGIHYLRSAADSAALGEQLADGVRLVVVGAGWIGSEVAASARQKGCQVTLIEPAEVPLQGVLGAEIGAVYRDLHLERGVDFKGGTAVEAFLGSDSVEKVKTTAGVIETDLVVVGIGAVPRTGLVEDIGLQLNNGVPVDAGLRTEIDGIYAAGDIANQFHPFYGNRIRVEHWSNARRQGLAAGRSMAGEEILYDELPYFFSDQYEVGMEYIGYAADWDEVVVRGDREGRDFIAFWLKEGRVLAGMNVNIWDVNETIGELIRSRRAVDLAALADPETDLATLAT